MYRGTWKRAVPPRRIVALRTAFAISVLAVLLIGATSTAPTSPPLTVSTGTTTVSAVISAAHKLFQIAAIVIGGIWAYYKFFRGRTFRPRLEPTLEASIIHIGAFRHLKVKVQVRNVGLSKVALDRQASGLRVFEYQPPEGALVEELSPPEWRRVRTVDVFKDHGWIESGETINDNWLFSVPNHQAAAAFRLELKLAGPKTDWYANAIVETAARPPGGVLSNLVGRLLHSSEQEPRGRDEARL